MSVNQMTRCDRHPDEPLSLKCGGCGKQMCTVCMTLTGEGPRCQECMARLNGQTSNAQAGGWPNAGANQPSPNPVAGVVLPAGEEVARQDAAREAYYATEPPTMYCARHPKVETLLRCGRCDTPICPKCMVHAGVGIRCPECAANPQRTIGIQAEQAAAQARGKAAPRDTGHRNYWYKNQAYSTIEPKHYALAILAGVGVALLAGIAWGFLLTDFTSRVTRQSGLDPRNLQTFFTTIDGWSSLITASLNSSIHLIPEIGLGLGIGAAIERITNHRVGPGLQLIAGLSFCLAIVVSAMTVGARMYEKATSQFPPVGDLFNAALSAIGHSLNSGSLSIIIFWGIGIAVAVFRLKR